MYRMTLLLVPVLLFLEDPGLAQKKDYSKQFTEARAQIESDAYLAFMACGLYSKKWGRAIRDGQDFKEELDKTMAIIRKSLDYISDYQDTVKVLMRRIAKPPPDYRASYAKLLELYGLHSQISELALRPSGSLVSFNQKVADLNSSYVRVKAELDILIP